MASTIDDVVCTNDAIEYFHDSSRARRVVYGIRRRVLRTIAPMPIMTHDV